MQEAQSHQIAIFKGKTIKKMLYQNEWWFSIIDVVEALTDSAKPSVYWSAMKARVKNENGFQLSTICKQLKLEASDGGSTKRFNKKYDKYQSPQTIPRHVRTILPQNE